MEATMQDYDLTLHHMRWRMERLFPGKQVVAKTEGGVERTTYSAVLARGARLANALQGLGIGPGDRVATLCWNNLRHLEVYYAVPLMGAVLHTLNVRLFPKDLEFIVQDAEDRVIFVDRTLVPVLNNLAGRMPTVRHVVIMDDGAGPIPEHALGDTLDYETLLGRERAEFNWPDLDERAPAGMCYTSGTTGNPKGVTYSHRSQYLHAMAELQVDSLAICEQDVVLPVVPMFHANAWGLPYACGLAGANQVFPDRWLGNSEVLADLAEREGVTVLAGVPTIWTGMVAYLEETGRRLPKVRVVISGGSAVPRALMERMDRLGLPILHAWGMTEMSPLGTTAHVRSTTPPGAELDVRLTQGTASPGVELRITDPETGAELPWDGVAFGELQVRGPWIARGYHRDADPTRGTEDGWFRTGDVAKMTPAGHMVIVDRTKDVIKSGGEWVSSVELENAIMGHPKVHEAAVIGLPHPRWDERPVAYVVPRPEHRGAVTAEEIKAFLADKVAKWWLPDEVRFIDEVPKTSVGKFDKKVLRASAEPIKVTSGDR